MRFAPALFALVALAGCMHFTSVPGETHANSGQQRAISKRIFELAEQDHGCTHPKVSGSEIVDLHPDAKVALERWTVTGCSQRLNYLVRYPATGRGTGFTVHEDRP